MKPRVYVETTIPSYLTARPSRDLLTAARQQVTRDWWELRRADFALVISDAVIRECSAGDSAAVAARLAVLVGLQIIPTTTEAADLANDLIAAVPLPPRVADDAIHLATATVHGVTHLLTWNCRHLANAALHGRMEAVCRSYGHPLPRICTPDQLLAGEADVG